VIGMYLSTLQIEISGIILKGIRPAYHCIIRKWWRQWQYFKLQRS